MTRRKEILDSLWLIKARFMDSEYFSYVLLAAAQKYKKEGLLFQAVQRSLNMNSTRHTIKNQHKYSFFIGNICHPTRN